MNLTEPATSSFRDPGGRLVRHDGRILRVVSPTSADQLRAFLATSSARQLRTRSAIVDSHFLDPRLVADLRQTLAVQPGHALVEHERIPFPSYPYEWPLEMLHRAAEFTLELSQEVLGSGYWLKDASPYNVLFQGPNPVFVDLLSFEQRAATDQTWLPYAQFVRTFLLVLLTSRHLGRNPAELLLSRRDGPEPREVYDWCSALQRLRPGFLGLVTLPSWLDRAGKPDGNIYRNRPASSAGQAEYVVGNLYRSLGRSLQRLAPRPGRSRWTGYLQHKSLYSPALLAEKDRFVSEALREAGPAAVLDAGCNEGHFSEMAARLGARVVAIDADPAVVGAVWRRAHAAHLDILPLVVDLTRPTPGIGWRNQECASFLERAEGHFDMVMMLAMIHHMLLSERIPLSEVLRMAAGLTRDYALIEFVGPGDPMFQQLVRGRDLLYRDLTVDQFERESRCFFKTIRVHRLQGLDRWLFLLRKHSSANAPTC